MLGFHANYIPECERFLSEESYIIDSKTDTEYLGRGMYFWEHQSKAVWWAQTHKKDSASMIVSAELSLENVLDLTDDDICKMLNKMFSYVDKSIVRKIARERNCADSKGAMGIVLDSIFEAFNPQMSKYDIVKAAKSYDKKDEAEFLVASPFTTKIVLILCAKTNAPIGARKKVS